MNTNDSIHEIQRWMLGKHEKFCPAALQLFGVSALIIFL
jgi:hypothetical protein